MNKKISKNTVSMFKIIFNYSSNIVWVEGAINSSELLEQKFGMVKIALDSDAKGVQQFEW